MKVVGFVSAVAACLLVMFYVMPNNESEETAEVEPVIETTAEPLNLAETITDDEYLAFLDGDDVVDFIIENEDIELDTEVDGIDDLDEDDAFYYLDEDIDDLYYDEL